MTLRAQLFAAATALALVLPGPSAQAQSLSDAMVLAYDSSDILTQQRNLLAATDEDVAQAVSALRPTISYFAQIQAQDTNLTGGSSTSSLGLILEWTLMDGGRRAFQIGAAKEAVLAGRWNLVQVEQQVLLEAVTAYLNLRLAARVVDVSESNLRLVNEQLRAARDRFEVGEVTRTDVALAEARLASSQSSLAAARGQVDIARERYRLATGHTASGAQPALPSTPALPPNVERAQDLAVQINPQIKALQHNVTAGELLVQVADARRLPSLSLQGRVAVQNDDPSATGTLTLGAQGPIYTGGNLASLGRQARVNVNADRAQLAQQARIVTDAVGAAWAQLRISRAQVMASREQVRSSQIAFDGFREEASLGARTTLDVLDAEQDLLDARIALVEAEINAELAVYQVLFAIGLLTVDHLGLAVERYDPSLYYTSVRTAPRTPAGTGTSERGKRLDRVLERYSPN